jgi:hypothetical protein
MKKIFFLLTLFACSFVQIHAQKVDDKDIIKVDLDKGLINDIEPTAKPKKIKKSFPNFSSETAENPDYNCGGGIFYLNDDMHFFTARDYVEIRSEFKGKISHDVLNQKFDIVANQLGKPDHQVKPQGDDEGIMVVYYKKEYGCLRLNYNISTGNVFELAIHYKPIGEACMDLCF